MNKNNMANTLILVGAMILFLGIIMKMQIFQEKEPNSTLAQSTESNYDIQESSEPNEAEITDIDEDKKVYSKEPTREVTTKPIDDRSEQEIIGQKFEDYFVNFLADKRFTLLDRTMDRKTSEGVYPESCKNPDLHISQVYLSRKVDYYIECKYRSSWKSGKVEIMQYQINRYRKFQQAAKGHKVLFALGVGGTPDNPQTLMLVPLDSLERNYILQSWANKYEIRKSSNGIYNFMKVYFDDVFQKAQERRKEQSKLSS
jgi:hypothetical protein